MDKLIEIYERFKNITNSYVGDRTVWGYKAIDLKTLYNDTCNLKFKNSKNKSFYEHMKRLLKQEIFQEWQRVSKKESLK